MTLAERYHNATLALADMTGLSDVELHVHVGLLVFVAVRVFTGKPFRSLLPLAGVLIVALINEYLDFLAAGEFASDSLFDIGVTTIWPAIISLVERLRRNLS